MPRKKSASDISNESLQALLHEATIPSLLLVVTKMLGMFLLPMLLGYDYQFSFQWNLTPFQFVFNSEIQAQIVNSYTNLAMFMIIFIGFFWVLIRSYHFHDTHIKPSMTAKLAELRMLHLITTSFEVYHSAFVWFCFMWLSVIVITIYYLLGMSFMWVFIGTFLTSVLMTYLLIDDLEKEFYIWRLMNEAQ